MSAKSDVAEIVKIRPDAGLVKSLGAHHTFESAIADLVDNCLDAGATRIAVRLLTDADRLVQVEVIDNGIGMDDKVADKAMKLGHRRSYKNVELGHFGIGLKAASFSHSDVLTVWSSKSGAQSVGRRIRRTDFSRDFSCERLTVDAADAAREVRAAQLGGPSGTTVVWSELRNSFRGTNVDEARTWMAQTERKVRSHLSVTFHRLIAKNELAIDIVVDESSFIDDSVGMPVKPVDPFCYVASGRPGYPKTLVATAGDQQIKLQCHIWPGKTDIPGFRINGKSGENFQGFYIYRNDRLLQIGGWSEVANGSGHRQLARVMIDEQAAVGTFLVMNPEKSGLRFEPQFRDALENAKASDGTTVEGFLADAEDSYRTANKRRMRRHPVIAPTQGFAPAVRKRVENESGLRRSEELKIRWVRMPEGQFFDIYFQNDLILLNQRYRRLCAPNGGSLNDAPVVKALLYLLTHEIFEGTNYGPKDKDNISLWRAVLGVAVEVEEEMRGA